MIASIDSRKLLTPLLFIEEVEKFAVLTVKVQESRDELIASWNHSPLIRCSVQSQNHEAQSEVSLQ